VPLVVLPFSTDQFAGAAALERTGVGVVLPPNTASVDELASAVAHVLDLPEGPREALVALSGSLRREPGRLRALAAVDAAAAGRLR
jgi:UDP:flavonoid glycosyltransferase YjiC (YdhE family)